MSEFDEEEFSQYLVQQEEKKLKKQFRGVMICSQPQRWQYSIEQLDVINEYPLVRKQKQKDDDPVLVKQEKKLLKDLKKIHQKTKDNSQTLTTTMNDEKNQPNCLAERSSSVYTSRQDDKIYYPQTRLKRGNSFQLYPEEKILDPKRSLSRPQRIVFVQNESCNLKEKFDEYNKAISIMNKQKEKLCSLPRIFQDKKSESRQNKYKLNSFYPQEGHTYKEKQKLIAQAMNEQQQVVNRIIQSKLDPKELDEVYNSKEVINMEMIDPLSSEIIINQTSPIKKKKHKIKRIKSAKENNIERSNSPQQNVQKEVKNILKYKSDLTNLYYNFMSQLK